MTILVENDFVFVKKSLCNESATKKASKTEMKMM